MSKDPTPYEFELRTAEEYDKAIRKSIPGYELIHEMAAIELGHGAGAGARVLCVGSGTGQELLELARRQQTWSFTGIDKSEAMNAVARRRLEAAGVQARVTLHTGEVASLPPSAPFDAGTSILVMHFIPDDGAKARFLADVAARLRPGARYLHCDIHGERGDAQFAWRQELWRRFQLARGTPPAEVDEFFQLRFPKVHPVSAARTETLLNGAGLTVVGKAFEASLFGLWVCQRA